MLARPNRLPKQEIPRIMREGRAVRTNEFLVKYRHTDDVSRFAIVISAKIDKRATARNRMRRLISETVRAHLSTVHADAVIIVLRSFDATEPVVRLLTKLQ